MIIDFLFAFVIALVIGGILAAMFGGRGVRRAGAWPIFLFLFLILLAMTWAGGAWIEPFGPTLWGGYFLPFLAVGIVIALLLAAIIHPPRPRRRRDEIGGDTAPGDAEAAGIAISIFFWVVILMLVVAIIARYAF